MGLAALAVGLHVDATRAWFAYLDAWLFGTSIAVGALLLLMTGHASKAGWMVVTRRPMESVAATLPLFALLFVPLAFGLDRVYPWAGHGPVDAALAHALDHKRVWLSKPFFVARTALYFLVLCVGSALLRAWSTENDGRPSPALVKKMRRLSGGGLPVVMLTLTWASFDWSMSLQPDWYSTMFGFYFFAGAFVGAVALACVMMYLMLRRASSPDLRAGARAGALRDGRLLGVHRLRAAAHLLDRRHPRRGELLRPPHDGVVDRGHVSPRVRALRRSVLRAPQPAPQAPTGLPRGRRRLGASRCSSSTCTGR